MKTCIISYSMSGNNERLAKAIAEEINGTHIVVQENAKRTIARIILDILFKRTPKVKPDPSVVKEYDKVILMGPVWMQSPATPLREYFKTLKKGNKAYSYVSVSGGAMNPNPKLKKNLMKWAGDNIEVFKDFRISELLNKDNVNMKETSSYQLTEDDVTKLKNDFVKRWLDA